jgi:hypothetical protein
MKILKARGCIVDFVEEWANLIKCINNMYAIQSRTMSGPSEITKVGRKLEIVLGEDV